MLIVREEKYATQW